MEKLEKEEIYAPASKEAFLLEGQDVLNKNFHRCRKAFSFIAVIGWILCVGLWYLFTYYFIRAHIKPPLDLKDVQLQFMYLYCALGTVFISTFASIIFWVIDNILVKKFFNKKEAMLDAKFAVLKERQKA